ncbi:MAG: tRNA pseudouridine(55) synthase TruB [Desulfomonilaceae bacterium]
MIHGLLLIDKPEGLTSNAVVGVIRRRLNRLVKVGHTGTLDPAASGLLVILLGAATRALDFLDETKKHYRLTIRLGEKSDTCDREGQIAITGDPRGLTLKEIDLCLKSFVGRSNQIPPHFSAIKIGGVPLYKLARKGVFPDLSIRPIEISRLSILEWVAPNLMVDLVCSKGTYARSLARDIGVRLRVGGRVETLRRIASGRFNIEKSLDLESVSNMSIDDMQKYLIPLSEALEHISEIKTPEAIFSKLALGTQIDIKSAEPLNKQVAIDNPNAFYRIQDDHGKILILARTEHIENRVTLKPVKVFNLLSDATIE